MSEFKRSKTILFYASFDGEVGTFDMMKQAQTIGKNISLPKIVKGKKNIIPMLAESLEGLPEGPYGIKQPLESSARELSLEDVDLVIVPGVAFDKFNRRLVRGGGYYDRFLKSLPQSTPTVGLAFDFQIVDSLPHAEHDMCVSHVLVNE